MAIADQHERIQALFTEQLERFMKHQDEASLAATYELGRKAIKEGVGELELLRMYHEALINLSSERGFSSEEEQLTTALSFLSEFLAPYEMRQRGFKDLIEKLNLQNQKLRDEVDLRAQTEEELRHSKEYFQSLIENALDIITISNYDGKVTYGSPSIKKVLGYTPQEIQQKNIFDYVHPNDLQKIKKTFENVTSQVGNTSSIEFRIKHNNGSWRYLESIAKSVDNVSDEPCVIVNSRDVSERVKARNKLQRSEKKLRKYSEQLKNQMIKEEKSRENERIRISREIHDELGQMLTVLKLDVSLLIEDAKEELNIPPQSEFLSGVNSITGRIDTIIKSVQRIAKELRPDIFEHLGLDEALEWQAKEFEKRTGIEQSIIHEAYCLDELSDVRAIAVYRIFQEALTNVLRHANATKIDIHLKEKDGFFILKIHDNGEGLDVRKMEESNSLGLVGMQERSRFLQGEIMFEGEKGKGTTVILKVPIQEPEEVN